MTVVRFLCGRTRCNTYAHTNSSASIATPEGHITVLSKYTCVSENVVYAIKCRTYNKLYVGETGKRLGDRFREHLRSTLSTDTDISVGRYFTSPGNSVGDMLVSVWRPEWYSDWMRTSTLYELLKSARACYVSLCFDFYLNVTLRVLLSVALNHWGRGSTHETSVFFVPFQRTFWGWTL